MSRPAQPMPRAEAAEVLGVADDAPPVEVQRAFLRAARHVHPDVLGDADDARRRAAGAAFVRLSRARDALLVPAPAGARSGPAVAARPRDPSGGPVFRRVPGRGLGGSLVVLALLAFLLVALVSFEQAVQQDGFDAPPAPVSTP